MTQINNEKFLLDEKYATTRLATQQKPLSNYKPEKELQNQLFSPANDTRKDEGGLRTQGYFKTNSDQKPLITVITVVFNGERYLEQTILSVIEQTYDNVEYIIIDGGSTDGTLDIIRRYENQIDYWVSEKDKGIYDAMNKGIDLTCGTWLNFMNAGDYFYSDNSIADVVTDFEKSGEYVYYYGNHEVRYSENWLTRIVNKNVADNDLWKGMFFSHQATFVNAKAYKLYKFDITIKLAADFDFFIKLYFNGLKAKKINKVISSILASGVSDTQRDIVYREYIAILLKHRKVSKIKVYFYFYNKTVVFFIKKIIKSVFPNLTAFIFFKKIANI